MKKAIFLFIIVFPMIVFSKTTVEYSIIPSLNISKNKEYLKVESINEWIPVKNKEKLNLMYSEKTLVFRLTGIKEKTNIFVDVLSPGTIKVLDENLKEVNSYGYENSKNIGFYPIFKIKNSHDYIYILRESNLRFDGAVTFPSDEKVSQINNFNFIAIFVFFGGAIFLIIYHFGLFLISRNKNYLYYVLFNTFSTAIILVFGLFFYNFLSTNIIEESLMIFAGLSALFSNVFARYFLDLKQYISPKRYNMIIWMERLFFLLVATYFILPPGIRIISANLIDLFLLITILNLIAISVSLLKKNIISRFYLLSWSFIFTGVSLLYLYEYLNVFADFHIIRYTVLIGYAGEMIINSLGLSYKVKMTEIKKTEAVLEAKQKKRYQNLLRILTHDISNPLTAAMSSADFIDIDPEAKDNLEESLIQIRDIIHSVKDQEKERSVSNQSVNAWFSYEKMKKTFASSIESKNIDFIFSGDKNLVIPMNEVVFINNIVGNLISNALKFSYENSKIIFKCEEINNKIKVSVQDFGAGIDEESLDKIKKGEITTSRGLNDEQGTGFGLNIIHSILSDHGASLKIETSCKSKSSGSVFSFFLEPA